MTPRQTRARIARAMRDTMAATEKARALEVRATSLEFVAANARADVREMERERARSVLLEMYARPEMREEVHITAIVRVGRDGVAYTARARCIDLRDAPTDIIAVAREACRGALREGLESACASQAPRLVREAGLDRSLRAFTRGGR